MQTNHDEKETLDENKQTSTTKTRQKRKLPSLISRHQDLHNQALYMVIASTRWFGLRIDLLCVPFITCVALASAGFSMQPGQPIP